jgi:hypothetical protein
MKGGENMSAAVQHVHKDLRHIARELEANGCELRPQRGRVEVFSKSRGVVVVTLTHASKRGSENPDRTRRELQRLGLLPEGTSSGRVSSRRSSEPTKLESALREAAEKKFGGRKTIEPAALDPVDPDRGPRKPRDIGVQRPFDHRRSPRPSIRYIGNTAWGDYVVRRLKKHLPEFDSRIMFVDFAIEVAKDRHLPPPNTRRGSRRDPWDRSRIDQILGGLLERKNAKSLTLQFFQAAVDELEGIPGGHYVVTQDGERVEVTHLKDGEDVQEIGVVAFDEGEAKEQPAVPSATTEAVEEATSGPQESPEPAPHGDLKQRLAEILLVKLESGETVDEALVDRIEKLLA